MVFNVMDLNFVSGSLLMGGSILGSLLPDIDTTKSYIGMRTKPFSTILSKVVKHRGITHSVAINILSIVLISLLSSFIEPVTYYLLLGIAVGVSSHIFLDSLTNQGVPIFINRNKGRLRLTSFSTGGVIEKITATGLMALNFLLILFIV